MANNNKNNYNSKNKNTWNNNTNHEPATAPFNFVCLPRIAVDRYNSKEELPAHNRIYREEEGYYSGEITYEVVVDGNDPGSVLMIGDDSSGNEKHFFRNNQGKYTIPGSTIRGMVRSNVQILGMCNPKADIQDSRFMYRKMAQSDGKLRKIYNRELGVKQNGATGRAELGKVVAGYIKHMMDDSYVIYPARVVDEHTYFRIKEKDLVSWVGKSSRVKYMKDGNYFKPYVAEGVSFNLDASGKVTAVRLNSELHFKGCLTTGGRMGRPGKPRAKQAHYLVNSPDFESPDRIVLAKNSPEINTYLDDLERKKQLTNKSFYMLPQKGKMKPVFYINTGTFTYFGMTPYLRIAYRNTVHDGIPESLNTHGVNYADAMFGYTLKSKNGKDELGYRARVSFTDAVSDDARVGKERPILLGEPKPTCYPEYLVQNDPYNLYSYADSNFRIRGTKQYWLIDQLRTYDGDNPKVSVKIKPVESGIFRGKIYFDNLAEDELGLLLYALYLSKDAYQNIGMGKPYGYGKVKIRNIVPYAYNYQNLYLDGSANGIEKLDIQEMIDVFKQYMNDGGVDIDSEMNVQELLYMKTHILRKADTEYQNLNEFKNNRVLPEVLSYEQKIRDGRIQTKFGSDNRNGHGGQRNQYHSKNGSRSQGKKNYGYNKKY